MDFDSVLDWTFWGNTLWAWCAAAVVGLGVGFGLRLVARGLVSRIRRLADRTATDLDDLVVALVLRTKGLVIFLVAVWAASLMLNLSGVVQERIRSVLMLGLLIQAGIWASGVVLHFLEAHKRRMLQEDPGVATAMGALGFIGRLVVWSLILLLALENLGVDITALVTTLGIGGVAVALALQNVLSDLFASLSIIFDKPFVVGDFIVVDDMMGTVEYVGLKTTRICALSGEQLVFSNRDLLDSRIRNFKRMQERRIVFQMGSTSRPCITCSSRTTRRTWMRSRRSTWSSTGGSPKKESSSRSRCGPSTYTEPPNGTPPRPTRGPAPARGPEPRGTSYGIATASVSWWRRISSRRYGPM